MVEAQSAPKGLFYERAQKVAEVSARSPEAVLVESLSYTLHMGSDLPPLEALSDYPNVQLWSIVLSRMPEAQSQRWRELNAKNKIETLTSEEAAELDHLLDLGDHYMLLHSKALVLLKQRGEDVDSYLAVRT